MDRTSRIGLVVCVVLLFGAQLVIDKLYPPVPKPRPAATVSSTVPPPAHLTSEQGAPSAAPAPGPAKPATPVIAEKFTVIENDAMKVTFTNLGGAITEIELKGQRADNGGNIILNEQSHSNVLALTGWPGVDTADFQAQVNNGEGVTYTANLPGGVKWQRAYSFVKEKDYDGGLGGLLRRAFHWIAVKMGSPETKPLIYTLDVTDTLTNSGATDVTLPAYSLSVGRALPLYDAPTPWTKEPTPSYFNGMYLGSGWLADKFHLTTINDFLPGYFIVFQTHDGRDVVTTKAFDQGALRWIGVENQFFTVLLTPASERSIMMGTFQCYNERGPDGKLVPPNAVPDMEAAASFAPITIPADKSVTLDYGLYAGPKDYNRLDALGENQGALMNYDGLLPFSFLIVPMLTVLHFWNLIFHNYGFAIILLTLMIKAITWPLQSFANRSGKRMQALAPKLKELQAKYKETPEKLQTETFGLYREYGVNPFGGCLPAIIQMPVFFSLYFMLQNAVELRGQSFFWVHDLTKPDAVWTAPFYIFGFHPSLHPLPIMVTALTVMMMRMTPQIGDPTQAKVAQFMPIFFLFIFYNFAAALSLYYVINNFVSIIQIYRNLKKPLPELKRVPRKKPGQGPPKK